MDPDTDNRSAAPASAGAVAGALAATFFVLVALALWPFGWSVLPAGWPQALASALLAWLVLAPLLWRLLRGPATLPDSALPPQRIDPVTEFTPEPGPPTPTASIGDSGRERGGVERRRDPGSARRDPLGRLPTRTELMERVQLAIDGYRRHPDQRFSLVFFDVDRFRQLNDSLGHAVGNELLGLLAERLRQALRPGDSVARVPAPLERAGREAGDEFLVLLDGSDDRKEVALVADRLLGTLIQPLHVGAITLAPSLSMGIVTGPNAAPDAEQALRDCDTALIEAKRSGRGRAVFFDAELRERVAQSQALEVDLQRALQRGELFMLYQPLVELVSHRLLGVEALLRWQHPQRDVLPPAAFSSVAETSGLADAIAEFALQTACRQFARWRRELGAGAPTLITVNLAPAWLKLPRTVQEIEAALHDNGMWPQQLQIDVADSLELQEQAMLSAMQNLKFIGVKLAIDGFGAGGASLVSLQRLPVDMVKIDPSFVARAHMVKQHRLRIEATVRVARSRGITVVAEGIETATQAALMSSMDCELGQGWFFGDPMHADDLARWEAPQLALTC